MEAANPDANIIFGASFSDEFEDEMRVTVIATGFDGKVEAAPAGEAARGGAFSGAAEKAKAAPAVSVSTEDVNDIDEIFKIFNKD